MQFQITQLRNFLSSIAKHNVEKIQIKSENLELTINADILITKTKTAVMARKKKDNTTQKNTLDKNIRNHNSYDATDTYFTIVSPMIGTFYRSPAPNEPSFIEINDSVKINQTVCIIEAMKLMNEIESEVNGHVVEILVQDGDIVDCGQALMHIKHK